MAISKISLPDALALESLPKVRWGTRENLGMLPKAARVTFSGAGSRDIASGVITTAVDEVITVFYPFIPGHLYLLTGTVTGSASFTVVAGGVAGGTWTVGEETATVLMPSAVTGSITFTDTATQVGTIASLMLTALSGFNLDLAYNS